MNVGDMYNPVFNDLIEATAMTVKEVYEQSPLRDWQWIECRLTNATYHVDCIMESRIIPNGYWLYVDGQDHPLVASAQDVLTLCRSSRVGTY